MFRVFFGDIAKGRLLRLPYLGYAILLPLLVLLLFFGFAVLLGLTDKIMGGDVQAMQDIIASQVSVLAFFFLIPLMCMVVFAHFNIMAKRIRDMGLPGWWGILGITIFEIFMSIFVNEEIGGYLNFIVWLCLVLIPGNFFNLLEKNDF